MKVLLLVYSPQKSFDAFSERYQTNFPWVDALIKELSGSEKINIGLVVPIKEPKFQITTKEKILIYGVPDLTAGRPPVNLSLKRRASLPDSEILFHTIKAIEDFNPDIIQVFGTENIFGMVQVKIKQPLVIHFQGSVLAVATKWFIGISKWEQICALSIRKWIYRYGSFFEYFTFMERGYREEKIMKSCKYFIGRTSFDRRLIKLLSPGATYFLCEEFIRNEFFMNKWEFPLAKNITCISILKGVTYKGIDLLIDTMVLLNRYSSFQIEFKICGVRENEEVVTIIKRKHRNNTNMSRIRFLGKLETNELIHELCSSNFYIHPSFMENSSNSICEAMALGMPVIATNVGGTSSLIQDGIDGLLVQEGEPFSMAASIVELVNDYNSAKLLGQNARERSKHRHDPSVLKGNILKIYQTILSENQGSNQ